MINVSSLEVHLFDNGFDRLMAGVLRIATQDYIKARKQYIRGLITDDEFNREVKIYSNCIENWSPYNYELINPEYLIRQCNEIADSGKHYDIRYN